MTYISNKSAKGLFGYLQVPLQVAICIITSEIIVIQVIATCTDVFGLGDETGIVIS